MKKPKPIDTELGGLPACASRFIKLVVKKMRYRKKVRAEVMAELATHFDGALKNCKSGGDREKTAEKLIAEFGDVKLLAVLLRRAKKRCRPLWRKVLVRSSQALAIIVLYIIFVGVYLGTGTPNISVNYVDWLNDLVSEGGSEVQNAKPYYDKAAELYVECPTALEKKCLGCGRAGNLLTDFNDLEMKHLVKWLGDNKVAFDVLRQGAEKPCCWTTYRSDGTDLRTGDFMRLVHQPLSGYHKLAQAMGWQIAYDTHNGKIGAALGNWTVLQKFGCDLQAKGLLNEQMVGIAIEAVAQAGIFTVLEKADVPADALKNLQAKMEKNFSSQQTVIDLEAEKVFWYDLVQRGFTDDGKGSGRVLKDGLSLVITDWKSSLWRFISFSYPHRCEVVAAIDRYFSQAKELLNKTPYQLYDKGDSQKWNELGKASIMLRLLGPAHATIGRLSWRTKTNRAGLLTTLAVLRCEKETGKYPDTLQELVPAGYLKQLPMDPYSGKPLIYKRTEDNFVIYSVGLNFRDDGGKLGRGRDGKPRMWANEGDAVFWPVCK
jgi:hypothetical protein